jgi:type II secretory pathway pseudopilin PulG
MLVVMAILGILAAVVTISMIGVTDLARKRAQEGEMMNLQSAMNLMLMDQKVDPDHACDLFTGGPAGVDDMSHFPSDEGYQASGGMGQDTAGKPVSLWPHYLRHRTMSRRYTCTGNGTVTPAG